LHLLVDERSRLAGSRWGKEAALGNRILEAMDFMF
jgi:hypothetical protein